MPTQRLNDHYIKQPGPKYYPTLRKIPFFGHFKKDEHLEQVVKTGFFLKVPPGVEVVQENESSRTFYVVIHGKLSVMKGQRAIAMLHQGEIFGELAALLGEPRTAHVLTLEESMLYEGDTLVLKKLPPDILFPFMLYLFQVQAKRLKKANRRLAVL